MTELRDPAPPLKVLHFRSVFSVLSETFVFDRIVRSEAFGVEAHVATALRTAEAERPFPRVHLLQIPARFHPLRLGSKIGLALRLLDEDLRIATLWRRSLRRLVSRLRPDVIHAHFGADGYVAAPVALAAGIPLIVTFYGYDVSLLPRARSWQDRYRWLFDRANALVGISNHVSSRLIELGADVRRIRTIHIGIEPSKFTYRDPALRFDGTVVRCVHVGRLTEKKGPVHLLRAFEMARRRVIPQIDLRLTIVGDGELRGAVERVVRELGLSESVTLLGAVAHERIPAILAEHHIYVQHCLTASNGDEEGLGLSFAEASACGLPIVTTRHDGIPDVVRDGKTGVLVEEGDVDGMGERIAWLARQPTLWTMMGQRGREHVLGAFDAHRLVAEEVELVRTLARHRESERTR